MGVNDFVLHEVRLPRHHRSTLFPKTNHTPIEVVNITVLDGVEYI